ncbi:MAG: DNA-processing protein DprA [Dehalococcoidia bacterium]
MRTLTHVMQDADRDSLGTTGATDEARRADADLGYWVALHRVHRLGSMRFALLEAAFPSMRHAWEASRGDLQAAGLDERTAGAVVLERGRTSPEAELERLARAGVQAIARPQAAYPSLLREIDDAPPVIYVRGALTPEDEWGIAVVGTRRATAYGRQAAGELSRGLAAHGITLVSGLARGIDTIAHRTALDTGGRTVAVLASGLDTIYPPENAGLAREIVESGALVTDYPLGTKPRAEFFPRRNRIMSGLALGTLIIEGDLKSGSMITARTAGDQNREVFAVPGSIFSPQSRGPLALIKDGATPICTAEEILEALNLTRLGAQLDFGRAAPPASDDEQALLGALSREPRHIDDVVRTTGLAAATVSGTLALLELKGLVRNVGGMQYARVREESAAYAE